MRIGYTLNGVRDEFSKSGIKTMAQAKSILRKVEEQIENEELGLIQNKNITLREYYPMFREDKSIRNHGIIHLLQGMIQLLRIICSLYLVIFH